MQARGTERTELEGMQRAELRQAARGGLRGLGLGIGYDSGDEALRSFYVPALSRARSYDRSVGYFRASWIAAAAKGVSRFVAGGGRMRLLIGAELAEADRDALVGASEIPAALAIRLASELVAPDEIAQRRLEVLAWLARQGRLQVKVAVPVDADGRAVPADLARAYFHEKIGILRDAAGDGVAFQGSVNESATAWSHNFESFSVYKSWDGSAAYFDEWAARFERRWAGDVAGFAVFDLPDPVLRSLVALAPDIEPPARDPDEGPERAPPELVAAYASVAPRLVGAQRLGDATIGVRLFPHQDQVVARLAGTYPRSWLVADEVGLGKTISAGVALRRLVLSGQVGRALVLAPAAVCRQWQDEAFEKLGLWVPRLDGQRLHGAHPHDTRLLAKGENPYAGEPILLASSHLARRADHQAMIAAAPALDLLVVDEAHHARRSGANPDKYRPTKMLELLDTLARTGHARATWLLTATPMQVHPIELVDLLRIVGLSGALGDFVSFRRYYAELAKAPDSEVDWAFLGSMAGSFQHDRLDEADLAVLVRIENQLGPVQVERIRRFGTEGAAQQPAGVAEALGVAGRRELRRWLAQRGPVGHYLTRHSRQTLRRYWRAGLLDTPVADRDVQACTVAFTPTEQALYDELDAVLDRLMQAHGTRRGAGFVLTIYRRRLTSSWAAIAQTLRRRIARERLEVEADLVADAEALDPGDIEGAALVSWDPGGAARVDDAEAVPLSEADRAQMAAYLGRLEVVTDSKFERLRTELDGARGTGRAVIVFTQFTDTLSYLRDRLQPAYRSHLATYSGDGGQVWVEPDDPADGAWKDVSKAELVDALRSGRVSVILATDAASEGLNLQVASYLINYDLPWNPMRVEQRIGRIDRIGQGAPVVTIRNYVIPGTIEESVYEALARRIDLFAGLVGRLQPILGATEAAFVRIFKAPRSERAAVTRAAVAALFASIDELESSGIDLEGDDDPLPLPVEPEAPLDLAALRRAVVEDLGEALDQPQRPATFDPQRVSRDPGRWCALSTYGHPRLAVVLERHCGALSPGERGPVVFAEAEGIWSVWRADRTPPVAVRTLAQLVDLGEAGSSGEAGEAALREAREAADRRSERIRDAEVQTRQRWLGDLRARYTNLVRDTINAESTLHARNGDGLVEPRLIWLDLTGRHDSAWRNADALRRHLTLEVGAVLPRQPPAGDPRPDSDLVAVRVASEKLLNALVREWQADGPAQT